MTDMNFEQAFKRLEEILEKMSSTQATLDDSLKLYEEADKLINTCQQRLSVAETKIEMLTKKRDGSLSMNEQGTPLTEELVT